MRKFNCHWNTDESKFFVFWSLAARVIDTDTCIGAYKRRHDAGDEETTNNVSYVPNVLSIQELTDKTKELLTEIDGRK